jgi:hypothetical protein
MKNQRKNKKKQSDNIDFLLGLFSIAMVALIHIVVKEDKKTKKHPKPSPELLVLDAAEINGKTIGVNKNGQLSIHDEG